MQHTQIFTHSRSLRRARTAIMAALLIAALLPTAAPTRGSDNYLPFVEPLQVTQKRAYYTAAPAGQDQPLQAPETPLTVPVIEAQEESESRLESLARKKLQALTLEESAQQQVLRDDLEQFGYSVFSRTPSTFAPVEGIPVPASYRIGPGDNIVIQLFGKRNVQYNLVVTRDGRILIPEFGPIAVGGLSFDDAEQLITSGFEQRMIGARAVVTMGKLRTIQVRLSGDVRRPGIYTIGGLSSLIDALLTTGGIAGTGTLRDIRLIRDGRVVTRLDLYELLLAGNSGSDAFLRHNDTIFVPAIGEVVYIAGEVQRPAIYELRGETTLGEALAMAGGMLPTASLHNSIIERILPGGSRTVLDFHNAAMDRGEMLATPLRAGDLLRILPLEDQLDNVVMLQGQVQRPGAYAFTAGMRVSDLLGNSDALLPGADLRFALLEREDRRGLRSSALYLSPRSALEAPGSDADLILKPRDRLQLFQRHGDRALATAALRKKLEQQAGDPRRAQVIELHGALRHSGSLPLGEGARLLDAVDLGGGLLSGSDLHYGVIMRRTLPEQRLRAIYFSLAAARRDPAGAANLPLQRNDRLYFLSDDSARGELLAGATRLLREQARFGEPERIVSILGEVLHPGDYPLGEDMRASDLLCAARGLTRRADGLSIQLSRSLQTPGGVEVNHRELESGELLELCAGVRRANSGQLDAVAMDRFLDRYRDARRNPKLHARDQLTVSLRRGWSESARVTLEGEVEKPGVYVIARGETLCEVLRRAGGLSDQAYVFGAEFTRRSVLEVQQRTLDELQDQLDDLLIELTLSHSVGNDGKAPNEWAGKQDTLKAIRQLERARATGRMVIDLERVRRCRKRDALVLEDGDRLHVPREPNHVQVAGQVYVATAHLYDPSRSIRDYIELSGGATVLGRLKHSYVIQANGEVMNLKGGRNSRRMARSRVMPGARIYVPLNVDRMNPTEKAQSWVGTLTRSAILAGIVL